MNAGVAKMNGCLQLGEQEYVGFTKSMTLARDEQKPLLHADSATIMQKGFLFMLPQLLYAEIKCFSAAPFHTGPPVSWQN